jgi:ketosteroid isomerase-like protein
MRAGGPATSGRGPSSSIPRSSWSCAPSSPTRAPTRGSRGWRYTRGFLDPWERITIEAEELVEAGDCVVAAVFQQGVGKGSGITTEFRYFHLWRLHDGRIVGLETFRDRDAALEAARASA